MKTLCNRLIPLVASVALAACDSDDPMVTGPDASPDVDADNGNVVEVAQAIEADTTWTSDKTYLLTDNIFVRNATLTIEPGTVIQGQDQTSLVITQTATIDAEGTASEPIVFTSNQPEGAREPGDWGGVVLLGTAPINVDGGSDTIEGFPAGTDGAVFGGDDPAHNCGTLKYVRIEFAGFLFGQDNELNGLTVGGCGTDTVLDYIQVHKGQDDGIEFFGGTANLWHAVITQPDDDGLDWDFGWQGKVQWIIVQQNAIVGNRGFESDSNKNNHDATPRSAPEIWNATLIGSGANPGEAGKTQGGMLLRRGTAGLVNNAIIAYFADFAIDVADYATVQQADAGDLAVRYSYFYNNGGGEDWPTDFDVKDGQENDCETPEAGCVGFDEEAYFTGADLSNTIGTDPELGDPLNLDAPDFAPADGSPVVDGGDTPPSADFDDTATYIGAIGDSDWTADWTAYPAN